MLKPQKQTNNKNFQSTIPEKEKKENIYILFEFLIYNNR